VNPLIYIVEDDADIADLIEYHLLLNGYETKIFSNGDDAYTATIEYPPDLLLLDLSLPGISGLEICKYIRNSPEVSSLPIIMITARGEETDKVIGLKAGADDYIAKPFGIKELLARIEALLRRTSKSVKDIYHFGELIINLEAFEISCNGIKKSISPMETRILKTLIKAGNRIVTYEEIIGSLEKNDFEIDKRTLYVYVQRLRNKLKECKSVIKTIQGIGYRLDV